MIMHSYSLESVESVEPNEWDWPFPSFLLSPKKFGTTANGAHLVEKDAQTVVSQQKADVVFGMMKIR